MAANIIRGTSDEALSQVASALDAYSAAHPRAQIDLYRQSRFSIRVRIIDPDFAEMSDADRNDQVWDAFEDLPEDVQSDITMLVLLTPSEIPLSGGYLEFEHPVPQVFL